MTAVVSFGLMILGALFMAASGGLAEEGSKTSARGSAIVGSLLLLAAWVLA